MAVLLLVPLTWKASESAEIDRILHHSTSYPDAAIQNNSMAFNSLIPTLLLLLTLCYIQEAKEFLNCLAAHLQRMYHDWKQGTAMSNVAASPIASMTWWLAPETVLMDTRHSATGVKAYVQLLRKRLGAGTAVYGSADSSLKTGERGVLITIIGPRWDPSFERNASKTDKSGHGVLTSITL